MFLDESLNSTDPMICYLWISIGIIHALKVIFEIYGIVLIWIFKIKKKSSNRLQTISAFIVGNLSYNSIELYISFPWLIGKYESVIFYVMMPISSLMRIVFYHLEIIFIWIFPSFERCVLELIIQDNLCVAWYCFVENILLELPILFGFPWLQFHERFIIFFFIWFRLLLCVMVDFVCWICCFVSFNNSHICCKQVPQASKNCKKLSWRRFEVMNWKIHSIKLMK